jgi:hypothetical protein
MSHDRFTAGERVRIRTDFPPGHVRTPVYVRGKTGIVTGRFGAFKNPEVAAYRLEGPQKVLYLVRFRQADLWPDYTGPETDTVDVDLYEHWLEKV